MVCEKCKKEHDGTYASGRFCSKQCAKSFSTKAKRNEINEKVSEKIKLKFYGKNRPTDKEIIDICKLESCPAHAAKKLNYARTSFIRRAKKLNVYVPSFGKGKNIKFDFNKIFAKKRKEQRHILLRALIESGRKYECEICKNFGKWECKDLTLQIDHIDGNPKNQSSNNLRFLCPNCHSQTITWGFKGRQHKN
jgi:5-methylcytosine-specific restriction endonuclease McrA